MRESTREVKARTKAIRESATRTKQRQRTIAQGAKQVENRYNQLRRDLDELRAIAETETAENEITLTDMLLLACEIKDKETVRECDRHTIYAATTTNIGADRPTTTYHKTREEAEKRTENNGTVRKLYTNKVAPNKVMTADDLSYYGIQTSEEWY